jgi:hypothetical protein
MTDLFIEPSVLPHKRYTALLNIVQCCHGMQGCNALVVLLVLFLRNGSICSHQLQPRLHDPSSAQDCGVLRMCCSFGITCWVETGSEAYPISLADCAEQEHMSCHGRVHIGRLHHVAEFYTHCILCTAQAFPRATNFLRYLEIALPCAVERVRIASFILWWCTTRLVHVKYS